MIDKQRYAAVRLLQALGYRWDRTAWRAPAEVAPATMPALVAAADAMHDELTGQIGELPIDTEHGPEEETLRRLAGLTHAYEAARLRDKQTFGLCGGQASPLQQRGRALDGRLAHALGGASDNALCLADGFAAERVPGAGILGSARESSQSAHHR